MRRQERQSGLVARRGSGAEWGRWAWAGKVEVEARESASVAGESRSSFLQDCNEVLGFRDFGPIAEDDWVKVAEKAA